MPRSECRARRQVRQERGYRLVLRLVAALATWTLAFYAGSMPAAAQKPVSAVPAGGAAQVAPSLDAILKAIAVYNGGIESKPFWDLRDYVHARKDDPAARVECEARLLQFLKTPSTDVARMAASRHLRVIGSDRAVPVLQAMLADRRSADIALYALQQVPGPAADAALVAALPALAGDTKIAVVAALGARRAAGAVSALAALLKEAPYAAAAAVSLGAIGGHAGTDALVAAYPVVAPETRPAVASSIVRSAERIAADGNHAAALGLYEMLLADGSLPAPLKRAAAIGRIGTAGDRAGAILMTQLEGNDPELREAAISRIEPVIPPDAVAPICALLPRLPETAQVPVLAALAGYPGERVRPAILDAARSESVAVRLAAIKALEATGDASVVPFLVEAAARSRGAEQAAARSALGMLKGRAVDDAIVERLGSSPPGDIERELLLAVADRRIFAAKSAVAASLTSASPRVRVQALKTLRTVGTPSDIPAALDAILASNDESERSEAETTTAALAAKIASAGSRSKTVKTRIGSEDEPEARVRIMAVLPLIGDDSALPLLREALADPGDAVYDAAVRALAAWPTSAAREDVLRLARDCRNETHRLLAIRGLVRIIGLDRYRDPRAAVADLRSAAGFAWRPEEQALVLGALAQFACADALDLATGFLREPAVNAEARAAIAKIKERMPKGRAR